MNLVIAGRKWISTFIAAVLVSALIPVSFAFAASSYPSISENFDDGLAQDWTAATGSWVVSGGQYGTSALPENSLSVYDGESWKSDYTFSVRMESEQGGISHSLGAVFNYVDADNYFELRFNPHGDAELNQVADGVKTNIATGSYSGGGTHSWFATDIIRKRDAVTVNVNGTTVFDAVALNEPAEGKIGLFSDHNIATFDDVSVTTAYKQTFPKLGGMLIGAKTYDNVQYQADISKLDMAILGFYRGWKSSVPGLMRQVVQNIKSDNPNILLGNYTLVTELYNDPNNTSQLDMYNKVLDEKGPNGVGDWWARNANGDLVSSYPGTAYINNTKFATPDANGDRYPQWFAKRNNTEYFAPIPEFDIWYTDNTMYKPRVNTDWDGDGVDDSQNDPTVQANFRDGVASYWTAARALQPNMLMMGNVDGHGGLGVGYLREPEYKGKIEAAFYENAMGKPYSEESWGTWNQMMESYRSLIQNTAEPHLVMFLVSGSLTDYPFMRYGLASSLLDDGYFAYNDSKKTYSSVPWFDEFDIDLGKAVDEPSLQPYQNGVYLRHFENGIALVNPKGNGTQTVTIEPGYKHFTGTQDPAVNNGQPVTTITLNERDGVILVKQ